MIRRLFSPAAITAVSSAHPVIHEAAAFRYRLVEDPPALVFAGELDGTNNRVLAAVLAPLAGVAADLTIDAAGLTYTGVEAAAMLARLAQLRPGHTTVIYSRPQLTRLLYLVDPDRILHVIEIATDTGNGRSNHE
jgi:hypothetical protein